ncbi:MAG: insulinase family protein [Planctomycetes bacterium]|nr:insulinase family protein [Planctomycetota bacterium]MBI3833499.1 insulinase family protein [Planctomycetota bacterium]
MTRSLSEKIDHNTLACGVEYGVVELPKRHVAAFQIRILAGTCNEPEHLPGLARLVEDTLDKGTERHTGRELSDAFDVIGAGRNSGAGRETAAFTCTVLPEHFERALELHAELLCQPTFPDDVVKVNLDLTRQELKALEDEPQALLDKLMAPKALGPILGRHPLGDRSGIDRITTGDLRQFWKSHYSSGRMIVSVAGPMNESRVAAALNRCFEGFGPSKRETNGLPPAVFTPGVNHHSKDLAQEHIAVCWPGVDATHDDFPIQQVILGVLAGGMSGRLFTEVREKQGLVYWVSAWQETPRGFGLLYMGASTTPERCKKTYDTLLREVNRLSDDLTESELERAKTGIIAGWETRGDATRARCSELASDLYFFGRPMPMSERVSRIQRVTRDDVSRYLRTYRRDQLCVMTLGPRALTEGSNSTSDARTKEAIRQ